MVLKDNYGNYKYKGSLYKQVEDKLNEFYEELDYSFTNVLVIFKDKETFKDKEIVRSGLIEFEYLRKCIFYSDYFDGYDEIDLVGFVVLDDIDERVFNVIDDKYKKIYKD